MPRSTAWLGFRLIVPPTLFVNVAIIMFSDLLVGRDCHYIASACECSPQEKACMLERSAFSFHVFPKSR